MLITDINEVPSLDDEINRKAFNTIEWLFAAQQCGDIDSRQFNTGVDALFMATSGLVDDEMLTLINSAGELSDTSAPLTKRHFYKAGSLISLRFDQGEDSYSVTTRLPNGESTEKRVLELDGNKAREKIARLGILIVMKGYVEI